MRMNHLFQHNSGLMRILLAISLIHLLSACQNNGQVNNSEQALKEAPSATTPIKWTVSMQITGGLKAENKTISINHQGVAQFTNSRPKITKNGEISTVNLNSLAEMVKKYTPVAAKKSSKPSACRDCYYYAISVDYDGDVSRQLVSDLTMDEKLKPLIKMLKKISSELAQQSK